MGFRQSFRRGCAAAVLGLVALFIPIRGLCVEQESSPAPASRGLVLTGIGIARHAGGTVVSLDGSAPLPYEYTLLEGRSLVLELPGAASLVQPADRKVTDDPFVSRIRVAEVGDPRPGLRVLVELKENSAFAVRDDGSHIVVTLGAPAGPAPGAETAQPAASPAAPPPPEPAAAQPRVTGLEAFPEPGRVSLLIRTEGEPGYAPVEGDDPARIVLAVSGAALGPAARRGIDLAASGSVVTRAALLPAPGATAGVRVEIDLREPAVYQVRRAPGGILVVVTEPSPAPPARPASPEPAVPAPAAVTAPSPSRPGAPAAPKAPPATPAAAAEAATYAGSPVTLDFVDADVTEILRLLAEVSGMNLVFGEEVKGKRTVHMSEVPWDQALDLILKTHSPPLVRIPEGAGVLRITTQKRVLDEQSEAEEKKLKLIRIQQEQREQELKGRETERRAAIEMLRLDDEEQRKERERRQEAAKLNEPLVRRVLAVSYGDAKAIAERLAKYASDRKDRIFELDPRSNTIIVVDLPANVAVMEDVLGVFDVPTPAVMVEARIVEVDSDATTSLGIQWGARGVMNASYGNATGYAFPNSVGIGGGVQQGSEGINPGTYLVNAPASNPAAGVALSLGHVADTLSLDVRLTALEKLGKTKILSNPKVLVVQNEDAKINVGQQLPVPKTDAEGNRTVEWKDVGILLAVKPQVTNDGRVFMKLNIEKSRQGESVPTTEGTMFSIDTSRAETKVIVGDGETSVIGGIFIQTAIDGQTGVPGLSRIPILGALFRSRDKQDNRKELMIFLTPRIIGAPAPTEAAAR